jgi:hypothetical protein
LQQRDHDDLRLPEVHPTPRFAPTSLTPGEPGEPRPYAPKRVEAGVEQGNREGDNAPARPQPPSVDLDEHDPAGCVRDWQRLVDARKPQLSQ